MLVTKKGWLIMLYPFMTLNDGTEIVHSETLEEAGKEKVEVRICIPIYSYWKYPISVGTT